jgi:DNA-binding transcriptional ArsR family regulator
MPIQFDEYTESDEFGNWLRPDSNSYRILSFLAAHPEQGFTPTEIHENVDIPMGSVGPTLQRLKERELVRHKGSYWAIARDARLAGLASTLSTLRSMNDIDDREDVDWEAEAADQDEMEAWRDARRE